MNPRSPANVYHSPHATLDVRDTESICPQARRDADTTSTLLALILILPEAHRGVNELSHEIYTPNQTCEDLYM